MSRHFNERMTILILHFLHFGALEIWTGDYHVLRENYTPYQKLEFFARYLKIINTFFEKKQWYTLLIL